jgi:hypothetical protein
MFGVSGELATDTSKKAIGSTGLLRGYPNIDEDGELKLSAIPSFADIFARNAFAGDVLPRC